MTEALHTKTEILTEIAPKNLNSKKAHILKSLFHFLVYSVHSTLFKIYKKWSVSLGIMEFNGACSRKTYEKWYVRPQDPTNSWGFTDEAAKCVQEKVVTEERFRDTRNDENRSWNLGQSPAEYSVADQSNLSRFLNEILITEAKFPDSDEAKEISEDMENMVAMMCLSLQEKSAFFQGCFANIVGSIAEKLKTGKPDEFDYNIILPNVAGSTVFLHDLHFLAGEINRNFFPDLGCCGFDGTSDIYFEIQDLNIFEGIVSQDEMDALYLREFANYSNIRPRFTEVEDGEIMQLLI